MNARNMVGFTQEYYTLQNVDGHDLALNTDNHFLTEDIAADSAKQAVKDYGDMILVRKHVDTVTRIFRVRKTVEEVSDTTAVAP